MNAVRQRRASVVLLSIDTTTFRMRRYVGPLCTHNERFDRLPNQYEVRDLMAQPERMFTNAA